MQSISLADLEQVSGGQNAVPSDGIRYEYGENYPGTNTARSGRAIRDGKVINEWNNPPPSGDPPEPVYRCPMVRTRSPR